MKLAEKEFAEIRERLYPMLMDPAQIQEKGQGQMVHGAIAEGLHVIYGIEEPNDKIRYVQYQDLRDWGTSHTAVHVQAVRNLEHRTEGQRVNRLGSPDGANPMFIWHLEDGFDAARILLVQWLDDFAASVPGRLVLGAPHRNWLVACGDEDARMVDVIKRRVIAEHHSADFPVSPFLYTWDGEKLERYKG
ncbi:MAG TPA: DUF1444 family protein [Symbiobacteriaceae bacterium]|nr:DUF1444 family protein [Symbiobacteriaceae bacterium]